MRFIVQIAALTRVVKDIVVEAPTFAAAEAAARELYDRDDGSDGWYDDASYWERGTATVCEHVAPDAVVSVVVDDDGLIVDVDE